MSDKQYKTEWSFSFDEIGKKIGSMMENMGGDVEIKTANFVEPGDGATSARVDLKLSMGKTTIVSAQTDNLFEADLEYIGEVEYSVSGDAEKIVYLGQKKSSSGVMDSVKRALKSIGNSDHNLSWNVRLSPNVPLRLDIEGGVGQGTFDLSSLQLTHLEMDGGVGENRVHLPQSEAAYNVNLEGGVGETTINVPENTALKITVDGGVGAINVNLPEGVAARVISDGTLGGVKVSSELSALPSAKTTFWIAPAHGRLPASISRIVRLSSSLTVAWAHVTCGLAARRSVMNPPTRLIPMRHKSSSTTRTQ